MTKREKEKLIRAMDLIQSENGYEAGMEILYRLVHGKESPHSKILKKLTEVPINVLATGKNRTFKVDP